jgi:hypothetical protein
MNPIVKIGVIGIFVVLIVWAARRYWRYTHSDSSGNDYQ